MRYGPNACDASLAMQRLIASDATVARRRSARHATDWRSSVALTRIRRPSLSSHAARPLLGTAVEGCAAQCQICRYSPSPAAVVAAAAARPARVRAAQRAAWAQARLREAQHCRGGLARAPMTRTRRAARSAASSSAASEEWSSRSGSEDSYDSGDASSSGYSDGDEEQRGGARGCCGTRARAASPGGDERLSSRAGSGARAPAPPTKGELALARKLEVIASVDESEVPTTAWAMPSRALALERAEAQQPRFKARHRARASAAAVAACSDTATQTPRMLTTHADNPTLTTARRPPTASGTPTTSRAPRRSR